MRIAIVISGYLRTFIHNIDSIKRCIIQDNEYDIYIHYTSDENISDKYYNPKNSLDMITKNFNVKLLLSSNNFKLSSDKKLNNLLNQNYKVCWLKDEMEKISRLEDIKYDVVVKTRPDVFIDDILDYDLCKDQIVIPSNDLVDKTRLEHDNGSTICDILAYGPYDLMTKYLDMYNSIDIFIHEYGCVNENIMYQYLHRFKIPYHIHNLNFSVVLSVCNIISISGDSGSGKTILSDIIQDFFNKDESFILECDRYHRWERDNENWKKYTHLNPEANFISKMERDVFDLKIGKNVFSVEYDHKNGKFTDKKEIKSTKNIIVCGLHSCYIRSNIINLKIFMDTDDNLRILWKIKRDVKYRGYDVQKVYEQIESRKEDCDRFIKTQKDMSDIIISMFSDFVFSIKTFNIDITPTVYLKIGLNKNLHHHPIKFSKWVQKVEYEGNFLYIYFKSIDYYKDIGDV